MRIVSRLAKGNPAVTLDQLCHGVRKQCGVSVSRSTMPGVLKTLGIAKGQGRPPFNESALKRVRHLARKNPEATMKEMGEAVHRQCGVRVSRSTLYAALKRLGLQRKRGRPRKDRRNSLAVN